jgi:hypothetical protein
MIRKPALIALLLLAGTSAASAQQQEQDKDDKTLDRAGRIASQPARDVGLSKDKIPAVLEAAFDRPYVAPRRCGDITAELGHLNQALGRDFDSPPEKGDDKATQIAQAGGEFLVNSLIPFRGLVREVTGAASAERRRIAAVNAGIARRGYLRGLAKERRCKLPPPPPVVVEKADKDDKKDGK